MRLSLRRPGDASTPAEADSGNEILRAPTPPRSPTSHHHPHSDPLRTADRDHPPPAHTEQTQRTLP